MYSDCATNHFSFVSPHPHSDSWVSWVEGPEKVVEEEGPSERQVEPWGRDRPQRKRCTSSTYIFLLQQTKVLLFIVQSMRIDPFFSRPSLFPLCICFVFTCASYYKRRKEQEQLAALKQHHQEEIDHHKKEIERLQREIDRHKGKIRKLKHDD